MAAADRATWRGWGILFGRRLDPQRRPLLGEQLVEPLANFGGSLEPRQRGHERRGWQQHGASRELITGAAEDHFARQTAGRARLQMRDVAADRLNQIIQQCAQRELKIAPCGLVLTSRWRWNTSVTC